MGGKTINVNGYTLNWNKENILHYEEMSFKKNRTRRLRKLVKCIFFKGKSTYLQ